MYRFAPITALTRPWVTLTQLRLPVRISRSFVCAILLSLVGFFAPVQSAFGKSFSPHPKRLKSQMVPVPGADPLKDAYAALDTAVLSVNSFSATQDLHTQLLALNQQVAANLAKGEPVIAPGVPKHYPDVKSG